MLYRGTKLILSGFLLAGVSMLAFGALSQPSANLEQNSAYGSISVPPASNGILTQCGDTFVFSPKDGQYGTIPEDYTEEVPRHPMIIPAYGYMSPAPFDADSIESIEPRGNPYSNEEILRAEWEGHKVIWTSTNYPDDGYEFVRDFADKWNDTHEDKLLVLSWPADADMPSGRLIAFSQWGATQTCMAFSEPTFQDFMDNANKYSSERDEQNPPVAPTTDGLLNPIAVRS